MVKRNLVTLALIVCALTSCTWHPAHIERDTENGFISVSASDPVFACRLKNDLKQRLRTCGLQEGVRINLNVSLSQGNLAYHPDNYVMRTQVRAEVALTIQTPNSNPETYTFTEVTAYANNQNEGWLNAQSVDSGYERLLGRITDVITAELLQIQHLQTLCKPNDQR